MEVLDAIFGRRSIRAYARRSVPHEVIITLLKAAMAAPTAVNCQPWEFIVTDDPNQMAKIREKFVFARYDAPVAIVVCGNMKLALKGPDHDMWIQDCSAATENLLIAAAGLGLGAVWIGVYPIESRVSTLRSLFNIPEHVVPLCAVYIGYPAEEKDPRTHYNPKRIYWGTYDPQRKHRSKNNPNIGHY